MMSMTRAAAALLTVSAAGALALADAVWVGQQPQDSTVAVSISDALLCPTKKPDSAPTTVLGLAVGAAGEYTPLAAESKPQGLPRGAVQTLTKAESPVEVVVSEGGIVGASAETSAASGLQRGLAVTSCMRPGTSGWFTGVDSTELVGTEILLVNGDDTEANVDLTFYGVAGRIPAPGSRSIVVPARRQQVVSLQPLLTQTDPFAIHVEATTGRVAAFARERHYREGEKQGGGVDWFPAMPVAGTSLVMPGVPAGPGMRQVMVVNPHPQRATFSLTALTEEGEKPLPEARDVSIPGLAALVVPVDSTLAGQAAAIGLTSETELVASVVSSQAPNTDRARQLAFPAHRGTTALPLRLKGRSPELALVNPGPRTAKVAVTVSDAAGKPQLRKEVVVEPRHQGRLGLPDLETAIVSLKLLEGSVHAGVELRQEISKLPALGTVSFTGVDQASREVSPQEDPGLGSS